MPLEKNEFRSALGSFATGVTIVTAVGEKGWPVGITVNAFSSVSLDPPLVLICIARTASCHPVLTQAQAFAVHVLGENQQILSKKFATRSPAKWEGIGYRTGKLGAPVLSSCVAVLECRTLNVVAAGDHDIIIGMVEYCGRDEGHPLVYFQGGYRTLSRSAALGESIQLRDGAVESRRRTA